MTMSSETVGKEGSSGPETRRILVLFGTRPEVIKLAPVIQALQADPQHLRTLTVSSGQHADLVLPFVHALGLWVDFDLQVGRSGQAPLDVCHRVLAALGPLLSREEPDLILVQGDTTTALAGSLAGFYQRILVGHVEAGLRSGDVASPYPEEMNRRLITRLASLHFAATERNAETLRREGIAEDRIVVTGNPVVDSVRWALEHAEPSPALCALLEWVRGKKLLVLTTHRRESFGGVMRERLNALRRFVDRHADLVLIFPVHPNPEVRACAEGELEGSPRIHLIDPLEYLDFIHLLSKAWLIVSDSGGIQEEAPSLGKPVLVIRDNTERPEAVEAGVARLVGRSATALEAMLEECYADDRWLKRVKSMRNPFGSGDSGLRIANALRGFLGLGPG
jgi:UDP-N-acetylglucosamine 2-epimerase (non-hydrolysing)